MAGDVWGGHAYGQGTQIIHSQTGLLHLKLVIGGMQGVNISMFHLKIQLHTCVLCATSFRHETEMNTAWV